MRVAGLCPACQRRRKQLPHLPPQTHMHPTRPPAAAPPGPGPPPTAAWSRPNRTAPPPAGTPAAAPAAPPAGWPAGRHREAHTSGLLIRDLLLGVRLSDAYSHSWRCSSQAQDNGETAPALRGHKPPPPPALLTCAVVLSSCVRCWTWAAIESNCAPLDISSSRSSSSSAFDRALTCACAAAPPIVEGGSPLSGACH